MTESNVNASEQPKSHEQQESLLTELLGRISEDELDMMIEAVKNGADSLAEAYGIEKKTLNAICQIGYSLYEAGHYDKAGPILGIVVQLDTEHQDAWRGLGAINQVLKRYEHAAYCYMQAIESAERQDSTDLSSKVLLGECLLLNGKEEQGEMFLKEALESENYALSDAPYIRRGKAILASQLKDITPIVLLHGDKQVGRPNLSAEDGGEISVYTPEDREINLDDIKQIPELEENFQAVIEELGKGTLNLADIGGFTQEQMDSLYAVATNYAQEERYEDALHIMSYLYILDMENTRNHIFVASVLMRMKQYESADHLLGMVRPMVEDDNILYLLNSGETKLMVGKIQTGLELLEACVAVQSKTEKEKQYQNRAEKLIQMFANRE